MREKLTMKRHKGALFIEYALILAFVILAGLIFITSGGLKDGVASIFSDTGEVMAQAAGEEKKQEQKEIKRYGDSDYFELSKLAAELVVQMENGTFIRGTDKDALAKLAEAAGVTLPEGTGDWVLTKNDDNNYQMTWTLKDNLTPDKKQTEVLWYKYGGDAGSGRYGWGAASVDPNGQISVVDNSTNVVGVAGGYFSLNSNSADDAYGYAYSTYKNGSWTKNGVTTKEYDGPYVVGATRLR